VIRPKMAVLPGSALIPDRNLIHPPPNRFTHEVSAAQPYYYLDPHQATPPEGTFATGTRVLLISQVGEVCRVADGRGLYVATACGGLRPLRGARSDRGSGKK